MSLTMPFGDRRPGCGDHQRLAVHRRRFDDRARRGADQHRPGCARAVPPNGEFEAAGWEILPNLPLPDGRRPHGRGSRPTPTNRMTSTCTYIWREHRPGPDRRDDEHLLPGDRQPDPGDLRRRTRPIRRTGPGWAYSARHRRQHQPDAAPARAVCRRRQQRLPVPDRRLQQDAARHHRLHLGRAGADPRQRADRGPSSSWRPADADQPGQRRGRRRRQRRDAPQPDLRAGRPRRERRCADLGLPAEPRARPHRRHRTPDASVFSGILDLGLSSGDVFNFRFGVDYGTRAARPTSASAPRRPRSATRTAAGATGSRSRTSRWIPRIRAAGRPGPAAPAEPVLRPGQHDPVHQRRRSQPVGHPGSDRGRPADRVAGHAPRGCRPRQPLQRVHDQSPAARLRAAGRLQPDQRDDLRSELGARRLQRRRGP